MSLAMTLGAVTLLAQSAPSPRIGEERAIAHHLANGQEFTLTLRDLIDHGRMLFTANWTDQDGVGRPFTKGNGKPLSDRSRPLTGARAFNRISGPDANSCAGCHNAPHAMAGGGGDYVTQAFVGAERFDFVTFDRTDLVPTRGSLDEMKRAATLQSVGNLRSTPGLFGAGYLEMLARQMSADLQRTRDSIQPGTSKPLVSKGVSFGTLARRRGSSASPGIRATARHRTGRAPGLPRDIAGAAAGHDEQGGGRAVPPQGLAAVIRCSNQGTVTTGTFIPGHPAWAEQCRSFGRCRGGGIHCWDCHDSHDRSGYR
jgi:hypothetical protein